MPVTSCSSMHTKAHFENYYNDVMDTCGNTLIAKNRKYGNDAFQNREYCNNTLEDAKGMTLSASPFVLSLIL